MKAKIAFLYGPEDLRVEEVELPPLKPNQILIKPVVSVVLMSNAMKVNQRRAVMT